VLWARENEKLDPTRKTLTTVGIDIWSGSVFDNILIAVSLTTRSTRRGQRRGEGGTRGEGEPTEETKVEDTDDKNEKDDDDKELALRGESLTTRSAVEIRAQSGRV
jgi:hypothetical protein